MIALKTPVAVAMGDGIGPEIMEATLKVLRAAGADLEVVPIEIGEKVYLSGETAGIRPEAWDVLRQHKVLLKAPITTPQGGGYKSLNVTIRKSLGLFANVRPTRAMHPFVKTHYPNMDLVIIRENEEDLYAGIEHRQTEDVEQCLKLITRPGCERIIRYAFEYARAYGREKVTCMSKDNIMKQTDGLFHRVFKEIGAEYPDIQQEHMIIDIGSALLAQQPERFDVIVTGNLYGDIISDIAAQVAGSVGLAGSSNIGTEVAMFEAIHGSAPDIAGKGIANPSGLLQASVMMLMHLGMHKIAAKVQNAWLATIEAGIHTADVYQEGISKEKVGTDAFAEAVITRLGEEPQHFAALDFDKQAVPPIVLPKYERPQSKKELCGADLFLDWRGEDPNELGDRLTALAGPNMKLKMITNRGVKVYPNGMPETFCTDHWRCRFVSSEARIHTEEKVYVPVEHTDLISLMLRLHEAGLDVIKTENLYNFDGKRGFSLGQGE